MQNDSISDLWNKSTAPKYYGYKGPQTNMPQNLGSKEDPGDIDERLERML